MDVIFEIIDKKLHHRFFRRKLDHIVVTLRILQAYQMIDVDPGQDQIHGHGRV